MSQDILGSLVRALVTVPENRLGLIQDLANKLAGSDGEKWEVQGKLFLRKQPTWGAVLSSESQIDPIIRVDRLVKPSYPDWVKEVLHPDLEKTGPTEYDITKIDQWLHDGQKDGRWITGKTIYAYLKENNETALKTCLGLRDLEEIQKKGIKFFRKHFKGKAVFGWASIVPDRNDNLNVPCLCESCGKVVLIWYWAGNDWNGDDPALRRASSQA